MQYHPSDRIGVSADISYLVKNNMPYYMQSEELDNTWSIGYENANGVIINSEIWYDITPKDQLLTNICINLMTLDDRDILPYQSEIKLNTQYKRNMFDNINCKIGIVFVSSKYSDMGKIDPYVDMKIGIDYSLPSNFTIYVNAENLFNQNIYLWNGYKERSLFANAGIMWQF